MLVRNYYSLCNNPEEHSSQVMTTLHYHTQCQLQEAQKKQEVKLMHRSLKFPSWINYWRLEINFPSLKKTLFLWSLILYYLPHKTYFFLKKSPKITLGLKPQHQKELYTIQSAPIKGYILPLVASYGTGHTILSENAAD